MPPAPPDEMIENNAVKSLWCSGDTLIVRLLLGLKYGQCDPSKTDRHHVTRQVSQEVDKSTR